VECRGNEQHAQRVISAAASAYCRNGTLRPFGPHGRQGGHFRRASQQRLHIFQVRGVAARLQEVLRRFNARILLKRANRIRVGIVEALEVRGMAGVGCNGWCHVPLLHFSDIVAFAGQCHVSDDERQCGHGDASLLMVSWTV
jgi:hypothetical protein